MSGADNAWIDVLSLAMANTLNEFRERLADRVELLAVDCHPWNGFLDLALLTSSEAKRNPWLSTPSEMAAWQFFHFSSGLASWQPASELARQMREKYSQSSGDLAIMAEGYLRACAVALASNAVQGSISKYELANSFRLSVPHPDTNEDFYPPE